MDRKIKLLFLICCFPGFLGALNVREFGAVGDGVAVDTRAIQAGIDAASHLQEELFFPTGIYLTGTLVLKDHVTLRLSKGAILLGSNNLADYPPIPVHYVSHINRYTQRYLLFAEGASHLSIVGEGIIDGQGTHPAFQADVKDEMKSIIRRPYVLRLVSCSDVKIEGITLKNSPAWMQQYLNCTDVLIQNIQVYNHGNYNNDGIDIDNCRNVRILGCQINSDDDGICFKTTNALGKCENVVVSNCVISSNCNAIKFGTETNGGFINFAIQNCVMGRPVEGTIYDRPHRALGGIAIETVDGATVEHVVIDNITMNGVMTPLFIRLANRGRNYYDGGLSQEPGKLRHITISNITAKTVGSVPSSITGIPGCPVEGITLHNIRFISEGGGKAADALRRDIPEYEKEYPETLLFDEVPAYGLFIRHARGITVNHITLEVEQSDPRPALYGEDVLQSSVKDFAFRNPHLQVPLMVWRDCRNIRIGTNLPVEKRTAFLQVEGNRTEHIIWIDRDVWNVAEPLRGEAGLLKTQVICIPD